MDSPRLSAELILACVLEKRRLDVLIRSELELEKEEEEAVWELILRRGRGEPVAYLLGHREFYGRDFQVGPGALIPRPETELIVDVCKRLTGAGSQWLVADICAGCGNIGITLCCEFSNFRCVMTDISYSALFLARRNTSLLGVASRVLLSLQDYAAAMGPEKVDLAVCNPPYVSKPSIKELSREVAGFEPKVALDGGETGLEAPLTAVASIAPVLRSKGHLVLETGWDQAEAIAERLSAHNRNWSSVRVHQDLQGHNRVVSAQKVW
ncbi:MAG: peptide chain release factor N(5)-glutamine methyltransferase [Desulfohalobiaceae bacterium]|nr:peptide chain release factor N(5)-glutamine methyltransferase [Desulfohalobiaceae bacterium]